VITIQKFGVKTICNQFFASERIDYNADLQVIPKMGAFLALEVLIIDMKE
jgi:hypothetical protein